MKYINKYQTLGLEFNDKKMKLEAYADASYLTHSDCKSHSGIIISSGNGFIEAKSKKQQLTCQSSTEAELDSLNTATNLILPIKQFLKEIGSIDKPITIYQDNQSTIEMAESGKLTTRTKHIGMRYHHVHDQIKLMAIKLKYTPTSSMLADFLTKPLGPKLFREAIDKVLVDIEKG